MSSIKLKQDLFDYGFAGYHNRLAIRKTYKIFLGDIHKTKYKYIEKIPTESTLKLHQKALQISEHFEQWSETEDICTASLVWNKYHLFWIKLPCNKPVLDRGSLFYMMKDHSTLKVSKSKENGRNINATNMNVPLSVQFICDNAVLISGQFVCDSKQDCLKNSDETICSQTFFNISLKTITDKTYLTMTQETSSDRSKSYLKYMLLEQPSPQNTSQSEECFQTQMTCIYEIIDRKNRRFLKSCSLSNELKSCTNFQCEVF